MPRPFLLPHFALFVVAIASGCNSGQGGTNDASVEDASSNPVPDLAMRADDLAMRADDLAKPFDAAMGPDLACAVGTRCGDKCVDTTTDIANCGGCGVACTAPMNAAPKCNGTCYWACVDGYGNCDRDVGTGCETDLRSTAPHCGSCDHDCLDSTCTDGVCDPITLASGEAAPLGIALSAASVYFTTTNDVRVVPKAGGAPTTIAAASSGNGIVLDGTAAYWVNQGDATVMSVPLAGGAPTTLATGQYGATWIATDRANVYYVSFIGPGWLRKLPVGGGSPMDVATTPDFFLYALVDGTNAYTWDLMSGPNGMGSLLAVPLAGGAPRTLATAGGATGGVPTGIAIDATHAYYTLASDMNVYAVPLAGGASVPLPTGGNHPALVVERDGDLFWFDVGMTGATMATLNRMPTTGGTPFVLAHVVNLPTAIAADGESVYWTAYPGGHPERGVVQRVAR